MAQAFDHLKSTYFQECAELLDSVYVDLAALEQSHDDNERVHAIFRAIHSIKGGGGAFGFVRLVAFAHVLESVLDLLRDNRISLGPENAALLLRATDALSDLVAAERTGEPVALAFEDKLLAELGRVAPSGAADQVSAPSAPPPPPVGPLQAYRIGFQPHADLFKNANEPLLLIRELKRLGAAVVIADLTRLPALASMDPEAAYIGWTIDLTTAAPVCDIEEVFEFVSDHCDLSITPLPTAAGLPMPALVDEARPAALVHAPDPIAAQAKSDTLTAGHLHLAAPTVRVDVEKVDRLVNLVGELVINQAMLVQLGGSLPSDMCPGLISGLETLSQHLRELQEGVMAIRTQPVRSVFSRMPRLVRELSAQLGKEVRLVIIGEGTEIDKTVIEQLADPLTHLLRNALDHGIESPARRIAQGKPPQGTVHLAAEHRGGRIVIEVADDGQGIDRARVLLHARQRGLVAGAASPSDEEIDNLIFVPGFSTAESVSSVSGRGVGLDVVQRTIRALGGRISLLSRAGAGSRFVLSLPLTLAILDGMIVAVGRESYIVPLTNIVESLRPQSDEVHRVVGCADVVAIRGDYVPLIHLARHFRVADAVDDPSRAIVVVVENESTGRVGLVVDELVGQQQVVVKSLEANYGAVDGIGGATILGNGRVALILDIAGLRGPPAPAERRRPALAIGGGAPAGGNARGSPVAISLQ
jgi:two-component system chemotaxis sensor kinase CheA